MSRRYDWGSWIALLLPLAGILPSVGAGVIDAADSIFHVHRIYALRLLLDHGELYPRWVSYFHLGYGYPIFNFYAPGSYYLGALLTYFGIGAPDAFNLISAFAWMIGSLGCYRLARRWLPTSPALLAALLWTYAPSRLFEVWEQGSLPQTLAAAFLPWLLLGIVNVVHNTHPRALLAIALPFAATLFTHQPTAVIAALASGVFSLMLVVSRMRDGWRTALAVAWRLGAGLALGAGIVGIFVVPALLELPYVDAVRGTADMIDVLRSGFLRPEQLFALQGAFDLTDLRRDLPKTFGLIAGLLAVVGVVALWMQHRRALALLLVGVVCLVALMLLPVSLPVWENIPLLAQLRFPERFLRIGVLPLALLGGASPLLVAERWRGAAWLVAGGMVCLSAIPSLVPTERFLTWDSLSAADEIRMEMDEYIWGSTSYNEFNPIWGARISLDPPSDLLRYRDQPLRIDIQQFDCPGGSFDLLGDTAYRFLILQPCTAAFRQYYYPGWVATLDGAPMDVEAEPELGLIRIALPAGEHTVTLRYGGTPTQAVGAVITLMSFALVVILLWMSRCQHDHASTARLSDPPSLGWRVGVAGGVACVGAALVFQLWVLPQTNWFRIVSPPDAPAAMVTRVDADFGGLFRLLGYHFDNPTSSPVRQVDIDLFWRAEQSITENYRPIVQLVDPDVTTAYAVSQPARPAAGHTIGWTPEYFASDPHLLTVFGFVQTAQARVSVQMVHAESGTPLLLPDGSDRLLLDAAVIVSG